MLFVLGITALLLWNLINVPTEHFRATVYGFMVVVFFIVFILDAIIKKRENIDVIVENPPEQRWAFFKGLSLKSVFLLFGVLSLLFLFNMSRTHFSLVGAPTFEVLPISTDPTFLAFMSGIVGIVENYFFFAAMFPTIGVNLSAKTGRLIGIPLGIVATSLVFVLYHALVYGSANIIASQTVFAAGVLFCGLTFAFRSCVPANLLHWANNFGLNVFKTVNISPAALLGF